MTCSDSSQPTRPVRLGDSLVRAVAKTNAQYHKDFAIMSLFFRSAAAKKVKELLSAEAEDLKDTSLRVFVKGGGCSGFQYEFIFDKKNEEDKVVMTDGVTLVVDPLSFEYLRGAEIDYLTSPFASQFVIRNPNVQTTCGCGSSFAV